MKKVFSSHVAGIDYDEASGTLTVTWTKGNQTRYADVPAEIAEQVAQAPSIGSALHALVRGRFSHDK